MEILIFKTNIPDKEKISDLVAYLDSAHGVVKWNFDLDDIDNILRVEAIGISPRSIENTISEAGYICEELPD